MKGNKKIIIPILVVALALCGFTIYKFLDNKKVAKEQEQSKQVEENKDQMVVNKKDQDGKDVKNPNIPTDVQDVAKVGEFFNNCLVKSFNIPDVTNKEYMENLKQFQKENFIDTYANTMQDVYKRCKESLKLMDYSVKKITPSDIKYKNNKYKGYIVDYVANIKIDNATDVLENKKNDGYARTVIIVNNNKLELIHFTFPLED